MGAALQDGEAPEGGGSGEGAERRSPASAVVGAGPGLQEDEGPGRQHPLLCCWKHQGACRGPREKGDFHVDPRAVWCLSHLWGLGSHLPSCQREADLSTCL